MNDEIKEILDKLKDNDWYEELDLTGTKWIELQQEETNQLLNYITNLQKANEILKEKENKLQEKFKDWKKEIEKERKHYLCDRTDCCGRIKDSKKYRSLYQENERLNNIIDDKKERQEIAIRLLHKLFGTDDYEINYIIGIINGQRQIKFDEELKEGKNGRL